MHSLPTPLLDYLHTTILKPRTPAYLLVGKDGRLSDWGGRVEAYGIPGLQKGRDIGAQVPFLAGLLPLENTPLTLSCVKIESGLSADVYLVPGTEGDWVLLLDATPEEAHISLLQQKTNDLALLRQEQSKLWEHDRNPNIVDPVTPGSSALQPRGERRDVTILFSSIREFSAYSTTQPPAGVMRTLDRYLRALLHSVIDAGGVVDAVRGETVTAVFGVLPSSHSTAVQAITAALQMIEAVRRHNHARQERNRAGFAIGVGVASGPVVLGMLGSKQRKHLGIVGHPLSLSLYLESQTHPWEIVIDVNTFYHMEAMQKNFTAVTFGDAEPVRAFSYIVG